MDELNSIERATLVQALQMAEHQWQFWRTAINSTPTERNYAGLQIELIRSVLDKVKGNTLVTDIGRVDYPSVDDDHPVFTGVCYEHGLIASVGDEESALRAFHTHVKNEHDTPAAS